MNDVIKNAMKYFYIIVFISLLVCTYFVYFVYNENFKTMEAFDYDASKTTKNFYKKYNELYYPLREKLTNQENKFIDKWIEKMEKNDIEKNKHISATTVSFTLYKNGHINKSRFGIGTKTKFNDFKSDVKQLLNYFGVQKFLPNNYNYYGVAWDIEDNLFKLYGLNQDSSKILCNVYNVKRSNNRIMSMTFDSKKYYTVGKDKTIMKKDGKNISQYNTGLNTYPREYILKYPKLKGVIKSIHKNNLHLDTYSEYDNKLNLYFEPDL